MFWIFYFDWIYICIVTIEFYLPKTLNKLNEWMNQMTRNLFMMTMISQYCIDNTHLCSLRVHCAHSISFKIENIEIDSNWTMWCLCPSRFSFFSSCFFQMVCICLSWDFDLVLLFCCWLFANTHGKCFYNNKYNLLAFDCLNIKRKKDF